MHLLRPIAELSLGHAADVRLRFPWEKTDSIGVDQIMERYNQQEDFLGVSENGI